VLPTGPGLLAAGAPPLAGGQNSIPSHVPLKSVLARGAGFVVGALPGGGAGVGLAATVAGALPRTDEGGAATDEAGAPTDGADAAGAVELAAAGGGSWREGAVSGDEPVDGVFGALPEHPPANKTGATATGTTILRIGPSPRGRSAFSGWLHSKL
jgi:hypothetical protein